ncbi:MAG: winged helix-turn-helix transcriptional regulator [Nitrospiraceae bacterium]|nr:winged helix-turn-helix transcriptional regulator [Nitrospiraceae bacterium]
MKSVAIPMKDDKQDVIYKIFRLLRENVVKILMALRKNDKIRWKELQKETGMSTATFNRALAALQEMHFISKEKGYYELTWVGKLVIDGFLLLGWRISDETDQLEDLVAEKVLAKDIIMAVIMIIFVSLRVRGKLNIEELEKEIDKEKEVIFKIIEEYEAEGYISIENGVITATEKINEITPENFLSME